MNRILTRSASLGLAAATLVGCTSFDVCKEAEKRLGYRACVQSVGSTAMWTSIAAPLTQVDEVRTTRYLVPARAGARLPTLFEDDAAAATSHAFRNHFEFLNVVFPKLFPALTLGELNTLITDPQRREFFAGTVTEYVLASGSHSYGYLIWDTQDAAGTITCDQAEQVHSALAATFAPSPLVLVPSTSFQKTMLTSCHVPSYDASQNVAYEVYNKGAAYGTLRRYTLSDFQQAEYSGEFGWQDIVVIDEAPFDIQTVVSGVVTGTRPTAPRSR